MKRYHSKSINMLNEAWQEITVDPDSAIPTKVPGTNETVFLRKFEDIGLSYIECLGDITPAVVDFITDRCWMPDGFVAWRIVEGMQQMIYFKGKVAIISVFKLKSNHFMKEFLSEATSYSNLDRKIVVRSTEMCAA